MPLERCNVQMTEVMIRIRERAAELQKIVGLPEVEDARTILAAKRAMDAKLARIVLVGDPDVARNTAAEAQVDISEIPIVNPREEGVRKRCATLFHEMRSKKGVTEDEAWEKVAEPLYCATCLLKLGEIQATVAGAINSTANVLRPLLQIVKCPPGISTVSSCFIMTTSLREMGEQGALIFADAGVVPNPSAPELADIAISSAESASLYLETEPRVAMLSFSTAGSANHPDVDKVREATRIAQEKAPDILIEGELQGDAALVPEVARSKFPGTRLEGKANVLVFPDLDAGNIAYKLVQRLAGAGAYGPLIQGLAGAGMDLSRGCTPDDIRNVVAVAAVRAASLLALKKP